MNFKRKLKLRCAFSVMILMLGLSALTLVLIKNMNHAEFQYLGYCIGTGGGLIGVGIVMLMKNLSALSDKAKMQSLKAEERDERNLLIAYKAGYYTFVASILVMYIISLVLLFIGSQFFMPIMTVCSVLLGFYLLFYLIVRKAN